MATTTYINGNLETLAAAMQQLVTMGYFASVEYDSENSAVICYDADENAVLTVSKNSGQIVATVVFRLESGTTKSITLGYGAQGVNAVYYIYVCSGGAYISFTGGGGQYYGLIISKTNNDKVGAVVIGSAGNASRTGVVNSLATDDDAEQINTTFAFGTPTTRNQTTLMNIPTCSAPNVVSYFPDVYYTFTSQYAYTNNTATPPQNFTQDGKRYLWVGYYAIRDEEAS